MTLYASQKINLVDHKVKYKMQNYKFLGDNIGEI